jgi:hypothetical protein
MRILRTIAITVFLVSYSTVPSLAMSADECNMPADKQGNSILECGMDEPACGVACGMNANFAGSPCRTYTIWANQYDVIDVCAIQGNSYYGTVSCWCSQDEPY